MNASTGHLLLDTHVFLWWADGEMDRVSVDVQRAIREAPSITVSIASAWEIAIKSSLGKMRLSVTFARALSVNGFSALPITLDHVQRVATLPRHHGDPFDRMLAAQAMHEGLTLVTHDRAFGPYALPVLWT